MGIYLNPSNVDFYNAMNHSQIYVDKTDLINYTNKILLVSRNTSALVSQDDLENQ